MNSGLAYSGQTTGMDIFREERQNQKQIIRVSKCIANFELLGSSIKMILISGFVVTQLGKTQLVKFENTISINKISKNPRKKKHHKLVSTSEVQNRLDVINNEAKLGNNGTSLHYQVFLMNDGHFGFRRGCFLYHVRNNWKRPQPKMNGKQNQNERILHIKWFFPYGETMAKYLVICYLVEKLLFAILGEGSIYFFDHNLISVLRLGVQIDPWLKP